MNERNVHVFPSWDLSPYLVQLKAQLEDAGWHVVASDRGGLVDALRGDDCLVHLHWTEALTPDRSLRNAAFAWGCLPLIRRAARRGGVVWTVHNLEPHEGFAPLVGRRFHRALARSVSALIVHRESTREALAAGFGRGCEIHVTPQASFSAIHGSPRGREDSRTALGIDNGATVFAQLGQLRHYKQPAETIRAFRTHAPEDSQLIVAGRCLDDGLRDEIESAAVGDNGRVRVEPEYLDDPALLTRVAAADWLIAPYRAIDNPTALELAVAYDRPVIAPDLPAVHETLGDHERILYDPDRDPVSAIGEAIASAAARPRTGGSRTVRKQSVSWPDQAAATIAVYESVIAKR